MYTMGLGGMGPGFDCAGNPSASGSQTDPLTGNCVDLAPAITTPSGDLTSSGILPAITSSLTYSPSILNPMGSPTATSESIWIYVCMGALGLFALGAVFAGGRSRYE